VKISVDRDRCVGSAYCQRIAPATFDLGDDGIAFVLDAGSVNTGSVNTGSAGTGTRDTDSDAAVREAETACPSMAISILEA
jgi:ferredoxin